MTQDASCFDAAASPAEIRARLLAETADHLAAAIQRAHEAFRVRCVDEAIEYARGGKLDAAIEAYLVSALHHEGTSPPSAGTTEAYALERKLHESRGLDAKTLAEIHGTYDGFRPLALEALRSARERERKKTVAR
jgi:hypothetical protein